MVVVVCVDAVIVFAVVRVDADVLVEDGVVALETFLISIRFQSESDSFD